MLKRGNTKTDVARILGVSRRALGFALERHAAASADPEIPSGGKPARPDPDPADDPADRDLTPAELGLPDDVEPSEIDAQIARARRNQALAESEGDLAEQRQQANMIRQFLALKERINSRLDPKAIVIPLEQVDAIRDRARAKFTAMTKDRPLLCSHCSRALSVSWARDPLAPAAEKEGES